MMRSAYIGELLTDFQNIEINEFFIYPNIAPKLIL